ncbi:MAG: HlyD family type I secretion periplasmic adaptor subunit [Geminicoccaceae bacterium]
MSSMRSAIKRAVEDLWLRLRGGEEQLRFLSLAVVMEEAVAPRSLRFIVMLVSFTVASFLVWSAIAEVNETTKGPGVVVPNGYVQVVQHLEGGIIADIATREGDYVEKGQNLVRLSGQGARNDLRQATIRQVSLEFQAKRLRAFIRKDQLRLNAPSPDFKPIAEKQQQIYIDMMAARQSEVELVENQLRQRKDKLRTLETRLGAVGRRVKIAEDLRDRRKKLSDRGLGSHFDYLRSDDRVNEALDDQNELLGEIGQARHEVTEFENRLISLDARYRDDTNQELERIETEIEQNRETIAKLSDRVDRLKIASPVKGIVKGLAINTIGEVVAPGTVLMEIVPLGEQLIVEMRIAPQDVAQIQPGQGVQIKVSSFDFARHGTIDGVLQSISATTFVDESGDAPYYLGRVAMDRSHFGDDPSINKVLPGMTVEANVVTGSKTILAYLLKPIHTSLSSALTER